MKDVKLGVKGRKGNSMKKKWLRKVILSALTASLLCFGNTMEAAVQVNPIPGLSPEFIKGADVSMLPELEKLGAKFYDNDGTAMDELAIMKKHGVNWIRVRIWNNPEYGIGGGGRTDEARALELAKRAKALGLKVLVDFHYSDGWADPNQQHTPHVWQGHSEQQLVKDVYEYTQKVVNDFKAQGTLPDMIQIGNEVKCGMLWPAGKLPSLDNGAAFAELMQSGLKAVRDIDPAIKLMIHLPDGGDNKLYRQFFDQLIMENGVNDFDVIGLSYYPFWHGSLDILQKNMDDISARYNKDVVIAETAYGFTLDNYDNESNHYAKSQELLSGFCATPQGQASGLRAVMDHVNNIPDKHGLGMFYWEPDWIAYPGAGWKDGAGNNWENLAMFDKDGKALDSWDVFKDVSDPDGKIVTPQVADIAYLEAAGATNIPVKLPKEVRVTYTDDHMEVLPITWENTAPVYTANGDYTVNGQIAAINQKVSCDVTVAAKANLLVNSDFEAGNLDGWMIDSTAWVKPNSGQGNAKGDAAMEYTAEAPFTANISQKVENLTDGKYTLEVSTQGVGSASSYNLYVIGDNGIKKTAPIEDRGWSVWHTTRISDVEIKNGKVIVGAELKAGKDKWGTLDNFAFYRQD